MLSNNEGEVTFEGRLANTPGGADDDTGIFRGDDNGELVSIVREGQAALDGNGSFRSFGEPIQNDAGQIAFNGYLRNTTGGSDDDEGLYIYDDLLGLRQVAREGSALLGSTITDIDFADPSRFDARFLTNEEWRGLNERGQVAFGFRLADSRSGIAVAKLVPEPSGLLLVLLATFHLLARIRLLG